MVDVSRHQLNRTGKHPACDMVMVFCEYACGHEFMHARKTEASARKLARKCAKRQCVSCKLEAAQC